MGVTQGCDYSFSRPTMSSLGPFVYVARYAGGSADKQLTAAEAQKLKVAGKRIVANYEANGRGGSDAQGVADAKAADAHFRACGAVGDFVIFFSIDFDCAVSSQDAYFRGVRDTIGLARTDAYGSTGLIRHLKSAGLIRPGRPGAPSGWRCMSTGWAGGAGSESEFAIAQIGYGLNKTIDTDRSYGDVTDFSWIPGVPVGAAPASAPIASMEDDDMQQIESLASHPGEYAYPVVSKGHFRLVSDGYGAQADLRVVVWDSNSPQVHDHVKVGGSSHLVDIPLTPATSAVTVKRYDNGSQPVGTGLY